MHQPVGSWTYVLVTPDGLITESLPWLLDKLRPARLEPVAGRLIRVNSATMYCIYDTPTRSRPVPLPPRRAFDLWYGLGPGCVLLLRHDGADACAAMLEAKGPTDPSAARAGSIRYVGENALMNLVHCPDDESEAAEELTRLLGKRPALDLQRLAMSPDDRVRLLTVDSLGDSLPARSGGEALSVPLIVNRLRLRIVQHLAILGSSSDAVLSTLTEIRSVLRDEHDKMVQMATSSGRASVARAHNEQLHGLLLDGAQQVEDPAVNRALPGLSALLMDSAADWRGTLAALHASGTYVSDTESAALELSTYI